jgi:hypothetical protein
MYTSLEQLATQKLVDQAHKNNVILEFSCSAHRASEFLEKGFTFISVGMTCTTF